MSFNVDEEMSLVDEGVWASYDGSKFKIAHSSNLVFQKELARLQAPHRRAIEKGTLPLDTHRDILCKAMAKGLVKDWQGVVNKAKEEVPYDQVMCASVLVKNVAFREFVVDYAANLDNYRQEELEALGNS